MNKPLIVDLDGTLIKSDILFDSFVVLIKNPILIFKAIFYLLKGKSYLKDFLSQRYDINPKLLPYNEKVVDFLRTESSERSIILCSASHSRYTSIIADHFGFFHSHYGTTPDFNLSGKNKAKFLVDMFGAKKFEYIGNSFTDLPIWEQADKAYVVTGSKRLVSKVKLINDNFLVLKTAKTPIKSFFKMIRVHQWLKNVLIFIPLFTSIIDPSFSAFILTLIGFFSFSFCASSVYILNDILDINNDRTHPRKKFRSLASGDISTPAGFLCSCFLLITSLSLGLFFLNSQFLLVLSLYFIITLFYTYSFKSIILLDCFTLALLYVVRIVSGVEILNLDLTYWLLLFSFFLFLSLSFLKRYSELKVIESLGEKNISGRAYILSDIDFIEIVGLCSGFLAILLFSLYINTSKALGIYGDPVYLLPCVLILSFWLLWVWFNGNRGMMHDDPVIFAVKDRISLFLGVAFILIIASIRIST